MLGTVEVSGRPVLLRLAGEVAESVVDGPGLRYVLFAQGCPHRCPGCHNPNTHPLRGGTELPVDELHLRITANPLLAGVTFSGGEPFVQAEAFARLGERLAGCGLSIWCYTGYTYEALAASKRAAVHDLLAAADVLVDGRYLQERATPEVPFVGSSNQRVLTLAGGCPVTAA